MSRRRVIFAAALLVMAFAASLSAATLPYPYIGLYADEGRSECSVFSSGGMYQFTLWIWVYPGVSGAMCADYQLSTPNNVIVSTETPNPEAPITIGSAIVDPGVSICFSTCRTDWFWTYQLMCFVTDVSPGAIAVIPHSSFGMAVVETCTEPYYTPEEMRILNSLGINMDCEIGLEESSWGAIKKMLDR